MLMRHPEKLVIKLTRMRITLASPYEKKWYVSFSISSLGAFWQDEASQKNAQAHE